MIDSLVRFVLVPGFARRSGQGCVTRPECEVAVCAAARAVRRRARQDVSVEGGASQLWTAGVVTATITAGPSSGSTDSSPSGPTCGLTSEKNEAILASLADDVEFSQADRARRDSPPSVDPDRLTRPLRPGGPCLSAWRRGSGPQARPVRSGTHSSIGIVNDRSKDSVGLVGGCETMRRLSMSASLIGIAAVVGAVVLVAVMWLIVLTRVGEQASDSRDHRPGRSSFPDE